MKVAHAKPALTDDARRPSFDAFDWINTADMIGNVITSRINCCMVRFSLPLFAGTHSEHVPGICVMMSIRILPLRDYSIFFNDQID